jgi:hypothetical protein
VDAPLRRTVRVDLTKEAQAMKRQIAVLVAFSLAGSASIASANEAWLLVSRDAHHVLVHATDAGFKTVQRLGDLTVYANANGKLAVLSRDKVAQKGSLLVIDKKTRKVEANWPVDAYPVSLLVGPSEEMILSDGAAYFASVRYASDGLSIDRNILGGTFDINRVSLADGTLESFPIPEEVNYPKLVLADGVVMVRTTTTAKVWAFDAARGELQEMSGMPPSKGQVETLADSGAPANVSAYSGSVLTLPNQTKVFVDKATGSVQKVSKGGTPEVLWDVLKEVPGASPSVTRIIAMSDNATK